MITAAQIVAALFALLLVGTAVTGDWDDSQDRNKAVVYALINLAAVTILVIR